ncbi:hypothetical protein D3C72_1420140 [compost metagenome]
MPGSTSSTKLPLTGARANSASPRAASHSPAASGLRMPKRITILAERPSENTAMITLAGRKASPICIGVYCSTSCMYSAEMKNHANMAAAHSTPTTLATDTLRSLNRPSGISGCCTRASMAMKTASSTTAAPSRPIVCVEPQPASLPLTTPYTASISDEVTVMAPATSSFSPCAWPRALGSSATHSAYTATPIGRLTRKIQCQLSVLVSSPPSSTPMLPPPAHTKPYTPIALARSAGSVNRFMMSESATADTTAPPRPCTARAATSRPCEVETPQASEASVNSTRPARNTRRWPYRSPSRPPSSRKPPKVSM